MMTPREREIRTKLRSNFHYYAPRALYIRTKSGSVESFKPNRAQEHLHAIAEQQLADTGKVRIIVLKGRQQGISTYIEGRFYWKVTHRKGAQAFILTHEQAATDNLYKMVQRYHENCPEVIRPQTGASNAKELLFNRLDSGYKIGTAGTKGAGRSSTIQFFHGSEAGFWPHAEDHAAGVMQAVPNESGTEIFIESTANGMGNYFHRMWQQAEAGMSDYKAVFIPWFWQPEYRKHVDGELAMTAEEADYANTHHLDSQQVAWMRAKIQDFGGDLSLFNQEYPATAALAFSFSKQESLITTESVIASRACSYGDDYGPVVAGLDPARFGDDRTALVIRRGRVVIHWQTWHGKDNMELAGLAVKAKEDHGIDKMFIDTGLGAGIIDRLREMGHRDWVTEVNFGSKALDEKRYFNKRAEMWGTMKEWLEEQPANIPDSDEWQADLTAPGYSYDSHSRLKIEPKESIAKRGLRSPDLGDALALTFAFPVAKNKPKPKVNTHTHRSQQGWMGM